MFHVPLCDRYWACICGPTGIVSACLQGTETHLFPCMTVSYCAEEHSGHVQSSEKGPVNATHKSKHMSVTTGITPVKSMSFCCICLYDNVWISGEHCCQELDSSWVLDMSQSFCGGKGFNDAEDKDADEGTEPKLDSRWEGNRIVQGIDKYKTKGKVQLLCDAYTWYCIAYSK